jgi:hypothetical protein
MASYSVRETFFRPAEYSRQASALPADLYNALQLLLKGQKGTCVFVPIRAMQYQAVADREEVIFVDSHGGYAHQDGEGGRLIRIAWVLAPPTGRDSLTEPVPCEVVFYAPGLKETQWRLIGEVRGMLQRVLRERREADVGTSQRRVLTLRRAEDREP